MPPAEAIKAVISHSNGKTFSYKLVLLGDSAVGKSSLALRFVKDTFTDHQESTIGAAFLTQTIKVDGDTLKLEIWDTAGQERYHSLAPMYYRGANAALVVYDVTNAESFERAKMWIKELHRQAAPNIVIALVGNKLDMDVRRAVPLADGEEYAQENGLLFFETSAKSGYNVRGVFDAIGKKLPRTPPQLASARLSQRSRLNQRLDGESSGGKCC